MDKTYQQYIEHIKRNDPKLYEPEKLTDSILGQIQNRQPARKAQGMIRVVFPVLGMTAAFLIGLFIVQYNEPVKQYTNPGITMHQMEITTALQEDHIPALPNDTLRTKVEACLQQKNNSYSRKCILSVIAEYSITNLKENEAFERKIQAYIQSH